MKSWNLPRSARRNQRGLRNRVPNGSGIFSLAFRDMFLIRNAPGGGGAVRNEHAAPRFSPQREGARYENRNRSCRSDLAAGGCIPCAKDEPSGRRGRCGRPGGKLSHARLRTDDGYGDAAESKRQRHIHLWRTGRQWKDRRGYLSAMVRAASLSCDLRIGSCPRAKALSASLSVTTIRMDRQ
jgi:hypothetical protein